MQEAAMVTEEPRKRRQVKRVAVVSDLCTGCGGSPVCLVYCKFEALRLIDDPHNYPFKRIMVDREACIGCGACVSGGKDGLMLTGCPWNAISLVALT
ncbi:MAG: 4Fe-4S dicluster domain-containing protein [Desulfosudaceae bacterium]